MSSTCTCANCNNCDGLEAVYVAPYSLSTQTAAGWEGDVNLSVKNLKPYIEKLGKIRLIIEKLEGQQKKFNDAFRAAPSGSAKEKLARERSATVLKRLRAWRGRRQVIFRVIKDTLWSLARSCIEWGCITTQELSPSDLLASKLVSMCDMKESSAESLAEGVLSAYVSGKPMDKFKIDYLGDFSVTTASI